ncbi:Na+/H+ antiporter [soil metagenome]
MEQFQIYLILFGVVVIVGQIFKKSSVPLSLQLVVTGMCLSFLPHFPHITLNPELVLNIFLPILIYQISSFSSWKDIKKHVRPIAMLSIGHVIFITLLVAIVIHMLLPQLGWPLAFVLGAVISPPDDVAIVSIAEKIRMPARIVTILEGEGMLNDATALLLFRFALAAVATHEFSVIHLTTTFTVLIIVETLYGLLIGYIIGELRTHIHNSSLHMIASILTPFIAYFPAEMLGGSGILATAATGFIIGQFYSLRFSPEFRLFSWAFWPSLSFALQNIIFLLVGLNLRFIINNISSIPTASLLLYSVSVILVVILGRFIWMFPTVYLPRVFASVRKKEAAFPWQFPIVISWAGMRGGVSLAAALAVPSLPFTVAGANPRDLLIFLVFSVIVATFLLQGLTLPWLLKVLKVQKYSRCEQYNEHVAELIARMTMVKAVLRWLSKYKNVSNDPKLLDEIKVHILQYQMLKKQLKTKIAREAETLISDEKTAIITEVFLLSQIIEIEKAELLRLWHSEKINLAVRNKLLERLDHRAKHLTV